MASWRIVNAPDRASLIIACFDETHEHWLEFTLERDDGTTFKESVRVLRAGRGRHSGRIIDLTVQTTEFCVLEGFLRTDERTGGFHEVRPDYATIKVVDGITFVWVPFHAKENLRECWLSTSGHRVRVFEPAQPGSSWHVTIHSMDLHNPPNNSAKNYLNAHDESTAFRRAVYWVKEGS